MNMYDILRKTIMTGIAITLMGFTGCSSNSNHLLVYPLESQPKNKIVQTQEYSIQTNSQIETEKGWKIYSYGWENWDVEYTEGELEEKLK